MDFKKLTPWVFILALGILTVFIFLRVNDNSEKINAYKRDIELLNSKISSASNENLKLIDLINYRNVVTDSLYKLIQVNNGKLQEQKKVIKRKQRDFENGTNNYRDSILFQYVRANQ